MNRYLTSLFMFVMGMLLGCLIEDVLFELNRAIVPEGKTWVLFEVDGPIFDIPEDGTFKYAWNQGDRINMDRWR